MIDTLAGIRVVEQGTFITGPCAGMMLADLGADVIKIESPEGDPYRSYQSGLYSPHFQAYNRNKRSLALDLKNAQDHALFERLVREADVSIQNFRPGTAERLGIGLLELDSQPIGRGAQFSAFEQARNVIGGHHIAPATCRGERGVAVSGGHVEHLLSGANVERLTEVLADDLQGGAHHRVVARGPGAVLTRFQRIEVGLNGCGIDQCGGGHDYSSFFQMEWASASVAGIDAGRS